MLRKIVLILLIFLSFSLYADDDYDAYQWYIKGKYFYKAGKIRESYTALMNALEIKSDYKEALELIQKIERIAEFEKIKLEREIIQIREEREKIESTFPVSEPEDTQKKMYPWDEVHFKMGENYIKQFKLSEAREEFLTSLKIFPENVIAEYYLFKIYSTLDDFDKVIEQAEKICVFIQPYILWKKLKEKGDFDNISKVIEDISIYFKYFPDEDFDIKFLKELKCYKNRKILEKAYFEYGNLANMKSFFKNSFNYKIISELNDYKDEDTSFSMDKLVEAGLIKNEIKCEKGNYYFYNGKIYCSECSLIEKKDYITIVLNDKDNKETLESIRDRNEHIKMKDIGDRFLERHKYESALLSFMEAFRLFPESYDVVNKIGVVHDLMGNIDEAEKYFRKTIDIRFDFIPAFNNLASVLYKKQNYEQAIIMLKKALIIKDTDFNLHYNLGLNYEKTEQFELAKEHYIIATLINGNEPDPFVHLAIVCRNLKDFDNAINYLIKARAIVENNPDMKILINQLIDGFTKEKNTK
ncbi:MAG: hypothetical protein M0R46_11995 [Candidatus Muirbacterium halophilum]|nr:hypothetical protein [Candidatus Muirbacterium halophilum]MCK9476637.1 hypothetical protein [Candidatus Muirbacterium halophilum]